MPKRKSQITEVEQEQELKQQDEIYDLTPPCRFEMNLDEFDKNKMQGYTWRQVGIYSKGNKEIIILEVKS